MNPPTKIELTEAKLLAGMRGGAGLKQAQATLLGVSWPPSGGWKRSLIGKLIDEDRYELFLSLKEQMGAREAFSRIKSVVAENQTTARRRRKRARKERKRMGESQQADQVEVQAVTVESPPATDDQTLGLLAARTAEVKELRHLLSVLIPVVEDAGLITDLSYDDRARLERVMSKIPLSA
jgi:hypothetical protein